MLGSLNMDLVVRTARLPGPGETILGTEFATSQGGKGANQAIAAARSGAAVTMIGAVGTDGFGDELLAALGADGVDTRFVRRVDGSSGIAVITVDDDAENTIVVAPGANGALTGLSDDDLAVISSSDLLIAQLEVPIETVAAGARAAAERGVAVMLNVSPARSLPDDLIAAVTLAVVNEGEETFVGATVLDRVPHVVTTLGAAGARYRGPQGRRASATAPRVRPVDTTGAGDAFTGALAVAWAQGADPHRALLVACAAGALATTRAGAGRSAPIRAEIDAIVGSPGAEPEI